MLARNGPVYKTPFGGDNGNAWTNAQTPWVVTNSSGTTVDIQSGNGRIKTTGSALGSYDDYGQALLDVRGFNLNYEIYTEFQYVTGIEQYMAIGFRRDSPSNPNQLDSPVDGLYFEADSVGLNSSHIWDATGSVQTSLGFTSAITYAAATWYGVRISVLNDKIGLKIWTLSSTEPNAPQLIVTTKLHWLSSGRHYVSLGCLGGNANGPDALFDNFSVRKNNIGPDWSNRIKLYLPTGGGDLQATEQSTTATVNAYVESPSTTNTETQPSVSTTAYAGSPSSKANETLASVSISALAESTIIAINEALASISTTANSELPSSQANESSTTVTTTANPEGIALTEQAASVSLTANDELSSFGVTETEATLSAVANDESVAFTATEQSASVSIDAFDEISGGVSPGEATEENASVSITAYAESGVGAGTESQPSVGASAQPSEPSTSSVGGLVTVGATALAETVQRTAQSLAASLTALAYPEATSYGPLGQVASVGIGAFNSLALITSVENSATVITATAFNETSFNGSLIKIKRTIQASITNSDIEGTISPQSIGASYKNTSIGGDIT